MVLAMIALVGVASAFALMRRGAAPAPEDKGHILYLHGRIVQERQDRRPEHPQWGAYELDGILEAFRVRGFTVNRKIRPKNETIEESADEVVAQVRKLRESGVPADRITIVGASMGASIALEAAMRLNDPEQRYVLLGACLSANVRSLLDERGAAPAGRILSIREAVDEATGPCPDWPPTEDLLKRASRLDAREIVLHTGLSHGFLYRPLPEWVTPTVEFASAPAKVPGNSEETK